jgi:hypothetical protein
MDLAFGIEALALAWLAPEPGSRSAGARPRPRPRTVGGRVSSSHPTSPIGYTK